MDSKELSFEDDKSVREGIQLTGFSDYIASSIQLIESKSMAGNRVITATLKLQMQEVIDTEIPSAVDRLKLLGCHIAYAMQAELVKNIPCQSIGGKVIMSQDEYESLRRGMLHNSITF